jgi:hypothetical protein
LGFAIEAFIRNILQGVGWLQMPGEIVAAIQLIGKTGTAFVDAPVALAEYLAMTPDEAQDINNYVANYYGTTPDKIDGVVETVLKAIISLHELVGIIEALIVPPAPAPAPTN